MDANTAIMLEAIVVLSILSLVVAARLFWKAGFRFVPQGMKDIYNATRRRLHEAGWG